MNRCLFVSALAGLLVTSGCRQPASSGFATPAEASAPARTRVVEIDAPAGPVAVPSETQDASTDSPSPSASDASAPSEYRFAHAPAVRNAAGVRVEFLANGHVTLRATDRWHHAMNVNYESATFFRNAVPVVSRTLTTEQADALQRVVNELEPVH